MLIGRIAGATRELGKPPGWDDRKGPCSTLPVRDELTSAGPAMTSAWMPTPEELARIVAGAPIYLRVMGMRHPPVMLEVGPAPESLEDGGRPLG